MSLIHVHENGGGRESVEVACTKLIHEGLASVDASATDCKRGLQFCSVLRIGKLVSASDQRDVSLPVLSDAVVPSITEESDVVFVPKICDGSIAQLVKDSIIHAITSKVSGLSVGPIQTGQTLVAEIPGGAMSYFHRDRATHTSDPDSPLPTLIWSPGEPHLVVKQLLGDKTFLLPDFSPLHFQLRVEAIREPKNPEVTQAELLRDREARVLVRRSTILPFLTDEGDPLMTLCLVEEEQMINVQVPEAFRDPERLFMVAEEPSGDDSEARDDRRCLKVHFILSTDSLEGAAKRETKLLAPSGPTGQPNLAELVTWCYKASRQLCYTLPDLIPALRPVTEPQLYWPGLYGDIAAKASVHYDAKKIKYSRPGHMVELIRTGNNMVKRLWIHKNIASPCVVADVACGHAQDYHKFTDKKCRFLCGVDISQDEILEARRRLAEVRDRRYPAVYRYGNLLSKKTWSTMLDVLAANNIQKRPELHDDPEVKLYSACSFQLAIHYCIQTQDIARSLLESINSILEIGGTFVGSCPDINQICGLLAYTLKRDPDNPSNLMCKNNDVWWISWDPLVLAQLRGGVPITASEGVIGECEKVTFDEALLRGCAQRDENPEKLMARLDPATLAKANQQDDAKLREVLNNTWNLKYKFNLVGHITDMEEFVVPWGAFVCLAEECGFELIDDDNFFGVLINSETSAAEQDLRSSANALLLRFAEENRKNGGRMGPQESCVRFYKSFAFRKVRDSCTRKRPRPVPFVGGTPALNYDDLMKPPSPVRPSIAAPTPRPAMVAPMVDLASVGVLPTLQPALVVPKPHVEERTTSSAVSSSDDDLL